MSSNQVRDRKQAQDNKIWNSANNSWQPNQSCKRCLNDYLHVSKRWKQDFMILGYKSNISQQKINSTWLMNMQDSNWNWSLCSACFIISCQTLHNICNTKEQQTPMCKVYFVSEFYIKIIKILISKPCSKQKINTVLKNVKGRILGYLHIFQLCNIQKTTLFAWHLCYVPVSSSRFTVISMSISSCMFHLDPNVHL